jgi:hypothetical protein
MCLPNSRGSPVDPVPFVVVTGLTFMILFSFGPLYGQALGAPLDVTLAVATVLFVAITAVSYYRQVWMARPELDSELPAGVRAERLFYLMLILGVISIGLAIPLLV